MPLYDYICSGCGTSREVLADMEHEVPSCCGASMKREYGGQVLIKIKYPLWIGRMEEIHKRQKDKGERLRMIHPSEVL